ncbi:hypothetical protein BC834DRAFT_274475 [Gloeopeniophorella convolvens]|nr:hypothetical protein BC834DRAFT_274475 [Gloeopeniophorella convolvens]
MNRQRSSTVDVPSNGVMPTLERRRRGKQIKCQTRWPAFFSLAVVEGPVLHSARQDGERADTEWCSQNGHASVRCACAPLGNAMVVLSINGRAVARLRNQHTHPEVAATLCFCACAWWRPSRLGARRRLSAAQADLRPSDRERKPRFFPGIHRLKRLKLSPLT